MFLTLLSGLIININQIQCIAVKFSDFSFEDNEFTENDNFILKMSNGDCIEIRHLDYKRILEKGNDIQI